MKFNIQNADVKVLNAKFRALKEVGLITLKLCKNSGQPSLFDIEFKKSKDKVLMHLYDPYSWDREKNKATITVTPESELEHEWLMRKNFIVYSIKKNTLRIYTVPEFKEFNS